MWNRHGATLEFTIPPTFLQSVWFKLLLALALAAILWFAYALRLRQVTANIRAGHQVRMAERERIARELHDTLLQGFHGLVLRFQAVADRVPPDHPARRPMDDALDHADEVLVEGRDRVRALRGAAGEGDPAQALVAAAAEAAVELAGAPPRFDLTVEGRPRPLHPVVGEELQRIGEEAIRNAFRHAQAKSVVAELTYGRGQLRLDIRDDGVGLPGDVAAAGERAGHYGLTGMRERAQRIGGALSVISRAGAGTEVLLSIPGRSAYAPGSGRRIWPSRTSRPGG